VSLLAATRELLSLWRGFVGEMVDDCPAEVLHAVVPGSTANSIAATFAHMVMTEDVFVQRRLRNSTLLYEEGGWRERTGIAFIGDPPLQTEEWSRGVHMDVEPFRGYAEAVYASTDALLAEYTDDDMDRPAQALIRESTVGKIILIGITTHFLTHAGEIAALRGTFGLKGLPF
jgi:hypothetical protein